MTVGRILLVNVEFAGSGHALDLVNTAVQSVQVSRLRLAFSAGKNSLHLTGTSRVTTLFYAPGEARAAETNSGILVALGEVAQPWKKLM